jgi:hypothetical protein
MLQLRIRLRTLLIIVAFAALIFTVILQTVLLQRSVAREQLYHAIAERERERAERERTRAEQVIDRSIEAQAEIDKSMKDFENRMRGKQRQ